MKERHNARRLMAVVGALALTLVLALPAAANEKVLIPEFSDE